MVGVGAPCNVSFPFMIQENTPSAGGGPKLPPVHVKMPLPGTFVIIRTSDATETILEKPKMADIHKRIGCDLSDTVNLRAPYPGYVMILDDQGHKKDLPTNKIATALYHANCRPGTTHKIRGDVAIVWDEDFA